MHYEVERFVEFFHPPVWAILQREETGHPRRFPDLGAAERAAGRCRQPGARRIVKVGDDGAREVVGGAGPAPSAAGGQDRGQALAVGRVG